jgi:hypothetical protein
MTIPFESASAALPVAGHAAQSERLHHAPIDRRHCTGLGGNWAGMPPLRWRLSALADARKCVIFQQRLLDRGTDVQDNAFRAVDSRKVIHCGGEP